MKFRLKRNSIDQLVKHSRLLRERFLTDKYRPGYHFATIEDEGIPGDPNGAFYAHGRYHLMYLYRRRDVGFCWGHISSQDLVHWRHHLDAIGPGQGDEGCFSGGAFVDDDGTAYLSYWKLGKGNGIGLVKSNDRHYEKWEKIPGNIIGSTSGGVFETHDAQGNPLILASADPSNIWKKGGKYYLQTGNLPVLNKFGRKPDDPLYQQMQGDWVDLFESNNLKEWTYKHRFYAHDPSGKWTDASEDDMCPSFLPLPISPEGGTFSGKYLQLFIAHNRGCQYYIGEYDTSKDKFYPEIHGRMSWNDNTFFAPEALIDDKGRQIMWAWLLDNLGNERTEIEQGWSGVYGLPRVLWLGNDGTLQMTVPQEFQSLRSFEQKWSNLSVKSGEKTELKVNNSESCEINLTINPNTATKVGLIVFSSPNEEEKTVIYYNQEDHTLVVDTSKSSSARLGRLIVEKAPFRLKPGEMLQARVFLDRCVVEIFVNERQAITRRVYPTKMENLSIFLFAEGGDADFREITAWEMMPSNPF